MYLVFLPSYLLIHLCLDSTDGSFLLYSPDSSDLDAKAAEVASMLARTHQKVDGDDQVSHPVTVPKGTPGKR